jgi:uncharacterized protein (AIM24 family)
MSDLTVLPDQGQSTTFAYRVDYRPAFALASLTLAAEQPIKAQAGAMVSMGGNVELASKMEGGLWGCRQAQRRGPLQVRGSGVQFVTSFGALHSRTLAAGQGYVVDTGHLVAWHASMPYEIRKATRSLLRSLTSGEAFVAEFTGPGTLLLQTRNLHAFADALEPFLPKPTSTSDTT